MRVWPWLLFSMACEPGKGSGDAPAGGDGGLDSAGGGGGADTSACAEPEGEVLTCDGGAGTIEGTTLPPTCGDQGVVVDLIDPLTGDVVVSDSTGPEGTYRIIFGCGSYLLRAGGPGCVCPETLWVDLRSGDALVVDLEACCG